MKKRWPIVALLTVAGIAAVVIGRRELKWEWGTLGQQGPFHGEPYTQEVSGERTSRVNVAPGVVAETFEPPGIEATVLRLTGNGPAWACGLVGTPPGNTNRVPIRRARLRGARAWDSGYKLLYDAEWDVSGSENGTIYLNADMTLNHFTMR